MKFSLFISAFLLLMCIAPSLVGASPIFDAPMMYHSRPNAGDIAFGDFNDDGILDVAHGQLYSELIMFHIGNGDGTFQSLYPYSIETLLEPDYIEVGDLNGDGLDDLVVLASNLTSFLSIYLSDDGSSAVPNLSDTAIFYYWSEQVNGLGLVDEDNDGDLDILLGGDYMGMQIMYNNGDDTFTDKAYFDIGPSAVFKTHDLNHDGYVDFVSAYSAGSLLITLSDGAGGYLTPASLPTEGIYGVGEIFMSDMTGDDEPDLVYTGSDASDMWIEIAVNQGEGVFTPGVRYDLFLTNHQYIACVGDIFGDGFVDIVTVNPTDGLYGLVNNIGTLNFDTTVEYVPDKRQGEFTALDLNQDGYSDLVGSGWHSMAIYLNHGDGTFAEPNTFDVPLVAGYTDYRMEHAESYDFNGDTYPDIAIFGQGTSGPTFTNHFFAIHYNDGAGNFPTQDVEVTMPFAEFWRDVEADYMVYGDFVGDAAADMVVCGNHRYRVFTGPLVSQGPYTGEDFVTSGNPVGIAADVDGDLDHDLVIADINDLRVRLNNDGVMSDEVISVDVTNALITAIDTVDLNGDGALDFVTLDGGANRCMTIVNDGEGSFSGLQVLDVVPAIEGTLIDVAGADFNGDGYGDAAVLWSKAQSSETGLVEPAVFILMNDGEGTLAESAHIHYIESALSIRAADFDGDGDFDVALNGPYPIGAAVLLNDGAGSFDETGINYGAIGPGGRGINIMADDFDLDDKVDIAVFQDKNTPAGTIGTVAILRNIGDSSNESCCSGRVGDANGLGDDEPSIGDVQITIDAKFISLTCDGLISCLQEADINQSGVSDPTCDDITIGDITLLIDYLFITGSSLGLPDCL